MSTDAKSAKPSLPSLPSLPPQSAQALAIARKIRLNILLNWRKPVCHTLARRYWSQAEQAHIPFSMVRGFLAVLD